MPSDNHIIIASAGSGKTTTVVDNACGDTDRQAAIITYTNNGRDEINTNAHQRFGSVPPHVTISTWYSFLLRHFVRPYQNCLYDPRVAGIHFVPDQSALRIPEKNTRHHFFSNASLMYSDKVSKFACRVIENSSGLPLQRFEQIFDKLLIDESQDLAGYDLELIQLLLNSNVELTLVGDPRQATYSTNSGAKNKRFRGPNIVSKFEEWKNAGYCDIEFQNFSHRCVQAICDFADQFHPEAPKTKSKNSVVTDHDGVFAIKKRLVPIYMESYKPQPLRYSRATRDIPGKPINYGNAKGMTFNRTLIYPHAPLKKFLKTGDLKDAGKELAKIYVAVTRARQSVAFVVDEDTSVSGLTIYQP